MEKGKSMDNLNLQLLRGRTNAVRQINTLKEKDYSNEWPNTDVGQSPVVQAVAKKMNLDRTNHRKQQSICNFNQMFTFFSNKEIVNEKEIMRKSKAPIVAFSGARMTELAGVTRDGVKFNDEQMTVRMIIKKNMKLIPFDVPLKNTRVKPALIKQLNNGLIKNTVLNKSQKMFSETSKERKSFAQSVAVKSQDPFWTIMVLTSSLEVAQFDMQ
ncbi:MAG: hypothetical protein EZS28_023009 [Streblomastix strix]|uniref:Tyr recombinase domain-containing protein n=1 Tax=Streblomastix strix TaxID=222440 RepID=A0A5J4VGK1_9EUKA|nr:MAG: hypothetical protein EZS28_023009 [Streblomastix strix]